MSEGITDRDVARRWWWVGVGFVVLTAAFVLFHFIGTMMLGLFVYYAARPFARRFEPYVDSPALAGGLAVLFVVLPFVVVFAGLLLLAVAQLASVRAETVTALLEEYFFPETDLSGLPSDPVAFARSLVDTVGLENIQGLLDGVLAVAGVFLTAAFHATLALLFAFFLLRDDRRLGRWFFAELADRDSPLGRYLDAVDRGLHAVFFGTVITIFTVIILATVAYNGLNMIAPPGLKIPQPILLAVVTGLATLIPLVGRAPVYIVVAGWMGLVAVTTVGTSALWFPVLFLAVMLLPIDQFVNFVVMPYFSGQTVHTGLMLFAFGIGTALFGWYGLFFGPFLLILNFEFVRQVLPELVRGDPITGGSRGTNSQATLDEMPEGESE